MIMPKKKKKIDGSRCRKLMLPMPFVGLSFWQPSSQPFSSPAPRLERQRFSWLVYYFPLSASVDHDSQVVDAWCQRAFRVNPSHPTETLFRSQMLVAGFSSGALDEDPGHRLCDLQKPSKHVKRNIRTPRWKILCQQ